MRRNGENGFALVLTLVVTALLVAVAVEFVHEVYVETSLHHNFLDSQQASLLAEGGVNGAAAYLGYLKLPGNEVMFQQALTKPLELEDERGSVSVTIEEEDGKLDLSAVNTLRGPREPFYDQAEIRLFKLLGLPAGLHDTLVDWVDENREPQPDGAETDYYMKLLSPYPVKDAKLDTFGELGLVKGFTPVILGKLRPYVTVTQGYLVVLGTGKIDINTAPLELIEALDEDMTEQMAKEIISRRRTKPFGNVGEIGDMPGMERMKGKIQGWTFKVVTSGSTYRFVSRAQVGEAVRVVEAVANIIAGGGKPKFLYWREY